MAGEEKKDQVDLQELLKLVKAQGEEIRKFREQKAGGLDPGTVSELVKTIKAQGEELTRLRELQEQYREQWQADMANAVDVRPVPYEDVLAKQEREAERLAREIHVTTHQAATMLLRKIKSRLTGDTWDAIAETMVKAYQHGRAKGKAAEFEALKNNLKSIIIDPRTAAGLKTGRKVQSSIWPDVEAVLDKQNRAGLGNPAPAA